MVKLEWASCPVHLMSKYPLWVQTTRVFSAEPIHDRGGPSPDEPAELRAVRALLQVGAPTRTGAAATFARRLVEVLVRETAATGGTVVVDRDDGGGPATLAWVAGGSSPVSRTRVDLPLTPPWRGHLQLDGMIDPTDSPYVMVAQRIATALEYERLRLDARRQQERLNFLIEVGHLLGQSLDSGLTAALIPRMLVPRLAPWCALYLPGRGGRPRVAAAVHTDEAMTSQMLSDQHGLGLRLHSAELLDLVREAEVATLPAPLEGFLVPLAMGGETLGALAVGQDGASDVDTITVVEEVARRAAAALANAQAHEERQRVAHTLQQALLPPKLPVVPGLEIGTRYVPAGRNTEVGGDLYDVIALADGRTLCVIGDVAGKGAKAATVTGLVREVLRILVREGKSAADALGLLNTTLRERSDRHCTLAVCELAPVAADGTVHGTVLLAGHDRPLVVRADGGVEPVGEWGTALGVLDRVSCPARPVVLHSGDSLVLYTDGATERRSADGFFGHERLHRGAAQLAGHPADVIAASLTSLVMDATDEPPRDDIAFVVVRNGGTA
jgi:serine phosphatase RsbU (regulator of sigma subunit)